jgi:CheY-like chemotaxis protein
MNEMIHREVPFLRRFARALVGRQEPADRLVAKAVDQLGSLPEPDRSRGLRLPLLRALVDAHAASGSDAARRASPEHATIADERIVASRVRSLPAEGAIALLLANLEGLTPVEIGFVMRLDETAAQARLEAAQRVLDAQAPSAVLIIEDEPVIAMDIAGIVRQAGHTVLGIATTRAEAVAIAARQSPGLILADIALADDSSGIKAVDDIRVSGRPPVIFITAYPERVLDDRRVEPSLLITKPFSEHLLRVAVAQALDIDRQASIDTVDGPR